MSKNKMRNLFRFDNENFSQSELNNYISSNKKLFKLKQTLIKLNNLDKNNYKHVIYGGSTSCCKLLCGLLTILGYENIYDENHKIKNKSLILDQIILMDKKLNLLLLIIIIKKD
jgi:hypothetical protein